MAKMLLTVKEEKYCTFLLVTGFGLSSLLSESKALSTKLLVNRIFHWNVNTLVRAGILAFILAPDLFGTFIAVPPMRVL